MADQNHFLIRKIHSLLGIIPIGIFFTEHMVVNAMAMSGIETWEKAAQAVHNMPLKTVLEILFIFLPLAFHGIYGLYIAFGAKNNATKYNYTHSWMFYLQRITAFILFAFIIWHVLDLKAFDIWGPEGPGALMGQYLANPINVILLAIGATAGALHFANGLWTFLISWGITIGPKAQSKTWKVCILLFIGYCIFALGSLIALASQ